jgi:hypothetical protein
MHAERFEPTKCQCSGNFTSSTTAPVSTPTSSPASNVPPPLLPKLSYAQQIRALEAKMSDEEQSLYLDARNMGEDFCSAGL